MKKTLLLFAAVAFSTAMYGQSVRLKTLNDSLSYALGIDAAEQFKNSLPDADARMVSAGVTDAIEKHSKRMSAEDARAFLVDYMRNRLPLINKRESEEYLAGIAQNAGVHKTESGLLYEIVEPGDPETRPVSDNDTVVAHYTGKLHTGKVFDSSYDRNEPLRFRLSGVIKGWNEGMKLIGKGGKIRLWLPAELAYGERGMQSMIPPNSALYFEVELLDVNP